MVFIYELMSDYDREMVEIQNYHNRYSFKLLAN